MTCCTESGKISGREPILFLPIRIVGCLAIGLPTISVFFCVVSSFITHANFISNYTICDEGVDSYITPVSYSIATFTPQKQLWMFTVVVQLPARALLIAMLPQTWSNDIMRKSFHAAASLSFCSLVCLSLFHVVTMAEYYVHATSFALWWASTIVVMGLIVHMDRVKVSMQNDRMIHKFFLAKGVIMSAFIIVSATTSIAYLLSRPFCSRPAFIMFCIGEYLLIALNATFEALVVVDFSGEFQGFQVISMERRDQKDSKTKNPAQIQPINKTML